MPDISTTFLNRWLDRNAKKALTRTRFFITIPAFSINNPNLTYSTLVGVLNFEAPNNFVLRNFVAPRTPTYLACISYTTQDQFGNIKVVRYKLWQGAGEVVYFNPPLYSGQIILKNFRYEIWSVPTNGISAEAGYTLFTSVLTNQDYRFGGDLQLVNNDPLVTNFNTLDAPGAPGLANQLCWWSWDSGITLGSGSHVASWKDKLSNILLQQATGAQQPTLSVFYVQFLGVANLVASAALANNLTCLYVMFLANVGGNSTNKQVDFQDGQNSIIGHGDGTQDTKINGNTFNGASGGGITVVEMNFQTNTVNIYSGNFGGPIVGHTFGGGGFVTPTFLVGDSGGTALKGMDFLGMLGYSQVQSAQDRITTLQYLLGHNAPYQGISIPLAFLFPANSVPVYNQITV